ncbi:MAG: hypothetical protein AB7J35_09765 [Dehalococcoidia bacterium]
MTSASLETSLIGQRVETFDHHAAGTVQAIEADQLLVKPAILPAYWINEILVRSVDDDAVRLQVDRRSLGRYMRDDPAGKPGPKSRRMASNWRVAIASLFSALWFV